MNPVRILHYLGDVAPETNLLAAIQAGLPSNAVLELAGRVGVTRTVILKKLDISENHGATLQSEIQINTAGIRSSGQNCACFRLCH